MVHKHPAAANAILSYQQYAILPEKLSSATPHTQQFFQYHVLAPLFQLPTSAIASALQPRIPSPTSIASGYCQPVALHPAPLHST